MEAVRIKRAFRRGSQPHIVINFRRRGSIRRPTDRSLALRLLGITEMFRSDEELARHAFEASRLVAVEAGDRRSEAWAIQALAWQAFRLGRVEEATGVL